jgi:ferredoxin-type protein NapF
MPNLSRRNFFQAPLQQVNSIRPPWAVLEQQFIELCTRCDECITVCPEKIIVKGDGGFPEVNFAHSGCELCEDCVDICKVNALDKVSDNAFAWFHKIKMNDKCLPLHGVICRSCSEACDDKAISFQLVAGKVAIPELDLDKCTGCGFCIAICPVDAVVISKNYSKEQINSD